ncbi:MAG: phasin [Hyphomicrobiales bacterium]|nr:phasin [Hyphomicrobiales bacterium]
MPQAKAKQEKVETIKMPTMEVPAVVREAAEKSVTQAKEAYDKMKVAAEETTDVLEDTYETARDGFVAVNLKTVEMFQANTDAAFDFAKKLFAVKSVADMVELQSTFARERFDAFTTQAKEMQELFSKVATETAEPAKSAIEKTMKEFKAA